MFGKVVALIFLLFLIKCRSENGTCLNLSTCGECIQQPDCVWCQNPKDSKTNCRNDVSEDEWCELNDRIVPVASSDVTQNKELSSQAGAVHVQMKPQKLSLRVPKNQEYTIDFQFARAENPLDLYFLMDASYTMRSYKEILATLGHRLVNAIANQTNDFRIGFGSFVDKTVFPFDYAENATLPCVGCERGYSFINHLNLTKDATEFERQVKSSKIASNLDEPEGGLEALMQVIVCTDEIGWRQEATRIVVFSTDDAFHVAGDGRLAGIVYPNDGLCHMSDHKYTKDKEIDYPSVSHISYMAKQHNIHIMFAIAQNDENADKEYNGKIHKTYQELSKNIDLSKYAALRNDSNAIIQLVVQTYSEILRSVKMTHTFPPEIIVDFSVKCPNLEVFEKGDNCSDLRVGQIVDFRATIEPLQCLKTKAYKIHADGIHESLTVDLEVICECDCERNVTPEIDAACSDQGHKECGICVCNSGFTGRQCECSGKDATVDDSKCLDPYTNVTCNGNGICACEMCECKNRYYGQFCSCEDFSCPKYNQQLCNGADHGRCVCGKCECLSGWSGTDCSCPESNKQCVAPYSDGHVCSGKGSCVCGKCRCDEDYFGDFCEGCTGCEWCVDLDPCVEAYISKTTPPENTNHRINCSSVIIIPLENATAGTFDTDWSKCLLAGKRGCNTAYRYKFTEKAILVEMGETTCPFIASLQGILLAILLPILIGGIVAILAWKTVVTYKDKKEYANFLKKRNSEKWHTDRNPLYKPAETEYENPMFKKNT